MLLAAACVAITAADEGVVLPTNPASAGIRSGSFTIADTASPALTVSNWLAARID